MFFKAGHSQITTARQTQLPTAQDKSKNVGKVDGGKGDGAMKMIAFMGKIKALSSGQLCTEVTEAEHFPETEENDHGSVRDMT